MASSFNGEPPILLPSTPTVLGLCRDRQSCPFWLARKARSVMVTVGCLSDLLTINQRLDILGWTRLADTP